jgi:hemerythrin-like domain-containing protein
MRKMMPIGPLMIEHRLIERMIGVMEKEAARIENEKSADPLFIETVVDFIRTYADRCHHGKEEDILFRELRKKNLSAEHRRVMEELISEHVWGRETTKNLSLAGGRYAGGDRAALSEITRFMRELAGFYPTHIKKEDKSFFLPVMGYFSQEEKDAMLEEELEFDRTLIHERYREVYQNMAAKAETRFG